MSSTAKPDPKALAEMSPRAKRLVKAFDKAAQWHGWARDQGTMAEAADALAGYNRARDRLVHFIIELETLP